MGQQHMYITIERSAAIRQHYPNTKLAEDSYLIIINFIAKDTISYYLITVLFTIHRIVHVYYFNFYLNLIFYFRQLLTHEF